MSHELDVAEDGRAAFVSARQPAWHGLGTVTEGAMTAEEAISKAYLDWEVTKHPVLAQVLVPAAITEDGVMVEHTESVEVPEKFATVRKNPFTGQHEVLGVVGPDYRVVQNWENAAFLNALVDQSGAHFETAGALRGGRVVFVSMKLPKQILIGGVDPVDVYMIASGSHDGTRAFTVDVTPIRVVCANTLRASDKARQASVKRRHTAGVLDNVQRAREQLGLTFDFIDTFQAEAEALLAKKIRTDILIKITDKMWDVKRDSDGKTNGRAQNRTDKIVELFRESDTNETGRGTAWGAYGAITEYLDWYSAAGETGDQQRMERVALGGAIDLQKVQAFDLLAKV
jgi:phage/plasmid-like protein (TIGR03299 family)